MKITKKDILLSLIDICIENGSALIVFTMNPNYPSPEITVIPYDNLEFKREYYKEFFTDELINKNNYDDKVYISFLFSLLTCTKPNSTV